MATAPPLITTSALDFRAALPSGGALIGLDLGTQTIGTAFCDAGWRFASPGKTLKRGKFGADKELLAALARERSVKGFVIGLPLNMDASEGPRSQASRAYARNLAVLGLPILLWDERWSTVGAERGLIEQDMSRAKRAERIDSAAAAVILQGAIDALARERSVRGFVIGLPINMDGSEGPRSQASRAYARNLGVLGLPILLWDERWSTTSAERGLIDQDMSRAKRATRIDSAAAAVILQGAIDALSGAVI